MNGHLCSFLFKKFHSHSFTFNLSIVFKIQMKIQLNGNVYLMKIIELSLILMSKNEKFMNKHVQV
jgi:hypothetical protein